MSEAALRAAVPPHFAKDSPCAPIFGELCGIRRKLEEMSAAKKTHTVCVRCRLRVCALRGRCCARGVRACMHVCARDAAARGVRARQRRPRTM
jgi:hypothetical protein